jgi:hypothetical protein
MTDMTLLAIWNSIVREFPQATDLIGMEENDLYIDFRGDQQNPSTIVFDNAVELNLVVENNSFYHTKAISRIIIQPVTRDYSKDSIDILSTITPDSVNLAKRLRKFLEVGLRPELKPCFIKAIKILAQNNAQLSFEENCIGVRCNFYPNHVSYDHRMVRDLSIIAS